MHAPGLRDGTHSIETHEYGQNCWESTELGPGIRNRCVGYARPAIVLPVRMCGYAMQPCRFEVSEDDGNKAWPAHARYNIVQHLSMLMTIQTPLS